MYAYFQLDTQKIAATYTAAANSTIVILSKPAAIEIVAMASNTTIEIIFMAHNPAAVNNHHTAAVK